MLESVHHFQEIKICKARTSADLRRLSILETPMLSLPVRIDVTAIRTVGGARGSTAPAHSQRHRRGGQLLLCAVVCSEHNQRGRSLPARGPTVRRPAC